MRRILILTSTLFGTACGSDGDAPGDTDDGTTAGDMSGPPSSTAAPSTGTPTSTSAATDSGTSTGSESGGSESTAVGSEDTSSGGTSESSSASSSDGGTGNNGAGEYAAIALPGGLDRIRITKRNDEAGTCTWVTLVTPALDDTFDVATTEPWSIESIMINDVPDSCQTDNPASGGGETAVAATGTIDLSDVMTVFPCAIDIDVDIDFSPAALPVPAEDTMAAVDVPVTGC